MYICRFYCWLWNLLHGFFQIVYLRGWWRWLIVSFIWTSVFQLLSSRTINFFWIRCKSVCRITHHVFGAHDSRRLERQYTRGRVGTGATKCRAAATSSTTTWPCGDNDPPCSLPLNLLYVAQNIFAYFLLATRKVCHVCAV